MISQSVIAAAQASMKKWKVPASVSIAQWALESGWGKHDLGVFNYFGIKSRPGQACVIVPTHEQDKYGHVYTVNAAFVKFSSPEDAFNYHAKLIATSSRYAKAMAALPSVELFVHELAPVYATDILYASKLMSIINSHNLKEYDKG